MANLQQALNEAHDAGVIKYEDYSKESPCFALSLCRERITITTEKALAQSVRDEISAELKKQRGW